MVKEFKSWFQENHTLVYFLIGQAIALGAALASLIAYSVRLETRVSTLETRGSQHIEKIESRLIAVESQSRSNKERIERLVDAATRK
jgi:hypothetical protein